ncbi:putative 4-hydroxyphenylacetate permease hpaX [Escherichia coli]|nr:putative 4-hydroxyphenylacetate permease hpaX [Escherichia coli]
MPAEMMDNDRLTLVQPEGAISHHAMQQRSMWREIFTPVVMMLPWRISA